jgi:hypothetical protein
LEVIKSLAASYFLLLFCYSDELEKHTPAHFVIVRTDCIRISVFFSIGEKEEQKVELLIFVWFDLVFFSFFLVSNIAYDVLFSSLSKELPWATRLAWLPNKPP